MWAENQFYMSTHVCIRRHVIIYVHIHAHTHTNLACVSVCVHLRGALNTKPSLSTSSVGCPAEMTVGVSPLHAPNHVVE